MSLQTNERPGPDRRCSQCGQGRPEAGPDLYRQRTTGLLYCHSCMEAHRRRDDGEWIGAGDGEEYVNPRTGKHSEDREPGEREPRLMTSKLER